MSLRIIALVLASPLLVTNAVMLSGHAHAATVLGNYYQDYASKGCDAFRCTLRLGKVPNGRVVIVNSVSCSMSVGSPAIPASAFLNGVSGQVGTVERLPLAIVEQPTGGGLAPSYFASSTGSLLIFSGLNPAVTVDFSQKATVDLQCAISGTIRKDSVSG